MTSIEIPEIPDGWRWLIVGPRRNGDSGDFPDAGNGHYFAHISGPARHDWIPGEDELEPPRCSYQACAITPQEAINLAYAYWRKDHAQ